MKTPFKMNPKSPLLQTLRGGKKVKTTDPKSGKTYEIGVEEKSAHAELASNLGGVPASFRAIEVGQKEDPFAANISEAESKSRAKAYNKKSDGKDWQAEELKKKMAKSKSRKRY